MAEQAVEDGSGNAGVAAATWEVALAARLPGGRVAAIALVTAAGLEPAWRRALDAALGPSRRLALAGVAGVLLAMLFWLGPPALRAATADARAAVAAPLWYFLAWMASFWFLFRGLRIAGAQQALYLKVLRDPRVDLLDLGPFAVCGRRAMDGALSAGIAATGAALVVAHPVVGPHPLALACIAVLLLMAVHFFVAALLPARSTIQRAKQAELRRVRDLLRGHLDGTPAPGAPPFQDLLAWEARVAVVPEWPVDPGAARRFAALLASPLIGRAGSAAVNAGLDRLLG